MKALKRCIKRVLEDHDGCCLDNKEERKKVTKALLEALKKIVTMDSDRCDDCNHLDEVHVDGGCLGGPLIDCECKAFSKKGG